jgi:Zn-dependent M28 family amino/carboxypeptidase
MDGTAMRRSAVFLTLVLLAATPLHAQRAAPAPCRGGADPAARVACAIRPQTLWGSLRFLASDELEGRGTGARGGDIAAAYLASQFMALGLEPAGDGGSYFHQVPIVTLVPNAQLEVAGSARAYRFRDDFVMWSEQTPSAPPAGQSAPAQTIDATGEMVFVGFGVAAPEWQWDDYKGLDVRGKILLMLVNDPGLRNPDIFRGRILTYYGRWTYKLEEAARRGAAGVLLVHNDTMATYGWSTVRNSWTGDQVRLAAPNTPLGFGGWITQAAAAELLGARGLELSRMMDAAARRDFRPVATGITVHGRVESAVRFSNAVNVVGRLPGSDPALRDQAVLITGHYDHLGIGSPVNGDSIMNGAVDNASGTAAVVAIAEAFAHTGVRARRSLLFVAFTGEEKGLLGSGAFAARSPIPLDRVAAILNIDVANLYAPTRDIAALGGDQSGLGAVFAQAARAEGLRVTVDEDALVRGSFFRSDHFPLARVGVPGLSFEIGDEAVGHPAGWMMDQKKTYNRERYHQPSDEILPWYTVDGAIQEARVLARAALLVGNAPAQPAWNATSEFRAAGEARLRGH